MYVQLCPSIFLDPKILLMVTFVVTHVRPVKKSVENSNMYRVYNRGFNGHLSICDVAEL